MPTRRERLLLLTPLALILLPFLIWPAVFGLLASFTNYAPAQLQVHWVGLANYASIVGDSQFQVAFRNTVVFGLTVPAELAIGFALAYLLREPFRGRGLVRVILLIPWLVSPIANGVMWHFLYNSQIGLINFGLAWLGLAGLPSPLGAKGLALPAAMLTDIWRKSPLVCFLALPGLLAIPRDHWELATLEGASSRERILRIALPRLRPLLLTIALLLIGDTLGLFDTLVILTGGGPGSATLIPALYSYQQAFQVHNWPIGSTLA
jgi:multiple sugar transport system permease protein